MDIAILQFVQNYFHNGFTDFIFPIITTLGNAGTVWIVIGVCLVVSKKYRKYGVLLFIALALTYSLGDLIIKPVVARPRPFLEFPGQVLLISPPNGYSFPSGHAGSSFAACVVLWRANKAFGIAAFVLAVLIAFSRVFLFVHFPSDVTVGAILGVCCALLTCFIFQKLENLRN